MHRCLKQAFHSKDSLLSLRLPRSSKNSKHPGSRLRCPRPAFHSKGSPLSLRLPRSNKSSSKHLGSKLRCLRQALLNKGSPRLLKLLKLSSSQKLPGRAHRCPRLAMLAKDLLQRLKHLLSRSKSNQRKHHGRALRCLSLALPSRGTPPCPCGLSSKSVRSRQRPSLLNSNKNQNKPNPSLPCRQVHRPSLSASRSPNQFRDQRFSPSTQVKLQKPNQSLNRHSRSRRSHSLKVAARRPSRLTLVATAGKNQRHRPLAGVFSLSPWVGSNPSPSSNSRHRNPEGLQCHTYPIKAAMEARPQRCRSLDEASISPGQSGEIKSHSSSSNRFLIFPTKEGMVVKHQLRVSQVVALTSHAP